jgi:hypothetical protein
MRPVSDDPISDHAASVDPTRDNPAADCDQPNNFTRRAPELPYFGVFSSGCPVCFTVGKSASRSNPEFVQIYRLTASIQPPRGDVVDKTFVVGEQRGSAAGVDEDDFFIRLATTLANVVDQAGHGFAAVDWIEQNALGPC